MLIVDLSLANVVQHSSSSFMPLPEIDMEPQHIPFPPKHTYPHSVITLKPHPYEVIHFWNDDDVHT